VEKIAGNVLRENASLLLIRKLALSLIRMGMLKLKLLNLARLIVSARFRLLWITLMWSPS